MRNVRNVRNASNFKLESHNSVVMMQYGNADITLDIIRGIDAIRTGAHALSWGLCESGHFCILML